MVHYIRRLNTVSYVWGDIMRSTGCMYWRGGLPVLHYNLFTTWNKQGSYTTAVTTTTALTTPCLAYLQYFNTWWGNKLTEKIAVWEHANKKKGLPTECFVYACQYFGRTLTNIMFIHCLHFYFFFYIKESVHVHVTVCRRQFKRQLWQ